jgi:hypothetical protein
VTHGHAGLVDRGRLRRRGSCDERQPERERDEHRFLHGCLYTRRAGLGETRRDVARIIWACGPTGSAIIRAEREHEITSKPDRSVCW